MGHLGERLRQRRLAEGVSLQHISEQTRIGTRYLEALEAGQFKALPGAIIARSFVRQYAEMVGIDPTTLDAELQQVFPSEDVLPNFDANSSGSTLKATLKSDTLLAADGPIWQRLPLTTISLTAALVISSVLYLSWQQLVLRNETRDPIAQQKKPSRQTTTTPQAEPGKDPLHSDRPLEAPASVVPAAASATAAAADQLSGTAHDGITLRVPSPSPSAANMAVRVVANEESWISIAANGQLLYEGTLRPREERMMNGVENARLLVRNAGGVDVMTDGQSIGPIGPPGGARIVLLKPQSAPKILEFGGAPPPGPPAAKSSAPATASPSGPPASGVPGDTTPGKNDGSTPTKLD